MDVTPDGRWEALNEGATLAWRDADGTCVMCVSGRVWITVEGVATDHMLLPGKRCIVTGRGLVVIEALRDAVFTRSAAG